MASENSIHMAPTLPVTMLTDYRFGDKTLSPDLAAYIKYHEKSLSGIFLF